jgi:hypothetical protein
MTLHVRRGKEIADLDGILAGINFTEDLPDETDRNSLLLAAYGA